MIPLVWRRGSGCACMRLRRWQGWPDMIWVCGACWRAPWLVVPGVRVRQCARVRGPGLLRST